MSPQLDFLSRLRRARARPACLFAAACTALVAACAAPPTAAVSDAELSQRVVERGATLADVEHALELADIGPLALPRPKVPDELVADRPDFWHACAAAWNPRVRQARQALLAARARTRSEGRAGPLELGVDAMDLGGAERETDVMLTFDLLGVFGVGPARAARDLARAEEREALGELEHALWAALFEVEHARMHVSGVLSRRLLLEALLREARIDEPRIEILARRGWVAHGLAETAHATVHGIEHELSMAQSDIADARAELAVAAGLDISHPALELVSAAAVESVRAEDFPWFDPTDVELASALPHLRRQRLVLAVAEAQLRREAAERWPNLRVGPQLTFVPGDVLPGGVLELELPWPGSVRGRIAAAVHERDAALAALEDELLSARARLEATRIALEQGFAQRDEHTLEMDLAAARAWVAAQATFRIEPEGLERWWMALRERTESMLALARARESTALAALSYLEARGPRRADATEVAP